MRLNQQIEEIQLTRVAEIAGLQEMLNDEIRLSSQAEEKALLRLDAYIGNFQCMRESDIYCFNTEIAVLVAEMNRLKAETAGIKDELAAAIQLHSCQKAEFKKREDSIRQANEKFGADIGSAKQDIRRVQEKMSRMTRQHTSDLEKAMAETNALKSELIEVKKKHTAQLRKLVDEQKLQFASERKKAVYLQQCLDSTLSEAQADKLALRGQLQLELAHAAEVEDAYAAEVEDLASQLTKIQNELVSERKRANSAQQHLDSTLSEAQADKLALRAQLALAHAEKDDLASQLTMVLNELNSRYASASAVHVPALGTTGPVMPNAIERLESTTSTSAIRGLPLPGPLLTAAAAESVGVIPSPPSSADFSLTGKRNSSTRAEEMHSVSENSAFSDSAGLEEAHGGQGRKFRRLAAGEVSDGLSDMNYISHARTSNGQSCIALLIQRRSCTLINNTLLFFVIVVDAGPFRTPR